MLSLYFTAEVFYLIIKLFSVTEDKKHEMKGQVVVMSAGSDPVNEDLNSAAAVEDGGGLRGNDLHCNET